MLTSKKFHLLELKPFYELYDCDPSSIPRAIVSLSFGGNWSFRLQKGGFEVKKIKVFALQELYEIFRRNFPLWPNSCFEILLHKTNLYPYSLVFHAIDFYFFDCLQGNMVKPDGLSN